MHDYQLDYQMTQGIREDSVKPKIEELRCRQCQKTFYDDKDMQIHVKTKHPEQNGKNTKESLKKSDGKKNKSTKGVGKKHKKNKEVSEFQQHEDKIYSFLGQLGAKSNPTEIEDAQADVEHSSDSVGKVGLDNNYMDNYFIRLPFETELNVRRELANQDLSSGKDPSFYLQLAQDILSLNTAVEAEKHRWQFMDPAEQEFESQDKLTLSDVYSLNQNYRRRGIHVQYPETTIILLWLGTFTRPAAWRQLTSVLFETRWKYQLYLRQSDHNKTVWSWKQFFQQHIDSLKQKNHESNKQFEMMDNQSKIAFLRLYTKWITLINPFQ